jgi:hypothetical protein
MPPQAAPADGRPQGADAPINQSREADHTALPLHTPEWASRPWFLRTGWPHEGYDQREQSFRPGDGCASRMHRDQRRSHPPAQGSVVLS